MSASVAGVRTRRIGGVVEISLDASATANALSSALVASLAAALESAVADEASIVVLRSTGSVFCGGFDLREPSASDADIRRRFMDIQWVLERLASAPFVTVALVEGAAVGAGADIVAACDYRVAGDDAHFRFPGSRFGVVLGLRRLVSIVGQAAASDIVLRAAALDADEAAANGLVTTRLNPTGWAEFVTRLAAAVERLDSATRASILGALRGVDAANDSDLLRRSLARAGSAERVAAYRAAVRSASRKRLPSIG